MIRAVTFDFWQTLADDTAEGIAAQRRLRLDALHAALAESGLRLDAAAVEAGYERSQALLESRFWDLHRDPGFAEQVGLVLDCVAPGAATRVVGATLEALLRGYAEPVLARPPALCPGAAEAVQGLAARGIALGIVSNTGRTPGHGAPAISRRPRPAALLHRRRGVLLRRGGGAQAGRGDLPAHAGEAGPGGGAGSRRDGARRRQSRCRRGGRPCSGPARGALHTAAGARRRNGRTSCSPISARFPSASPPCEWQGPPRAGAYCAIGSGRVTSGPA